MINVRSLVISSLMLLFIFVADSSAQQFRFADAVIECIDNGGSPDTMDAIDDSIRIRLTIGGDIRYTDLLELTMKPSAGSGVIPYTPDTIECVTSGANFNGYRMHTDTLQFGRGLSGNHPDSARIVASIKLRLTSLCVPAGHVLSFEVGARGVWNAGGPLDKCGQDDISIVLPCGYCTSPTNVCGNVSGVWEMAGSPYYVNCDVTVPTGQTLEIRPGVHVLFTGHYRFIVNGNLQAIGTEEDSIVFSRAYQTEASKGFGIRFTLTDTLGLMEYCIIEYGKADGTSYEALGGGVFCLESSPKFRNCTIRNNSARGAAGIQCDGCSPEFKDCVIIENTAFDGDGGGIGTWHAHPVFDHCVIAHNTSTWTTGGGIAVRGDQSWPSSPEFINCTIISNDPVSSGSAIYFAWPATLQNCIVAFNTGNGILFESAANQSQILYNDFYSNQAGTFSGSIPSNIGAITTVNVNGDSCDQNYNIYLDPLFIDRVSDNFCLQSVSPCIDAGNPSSPLDPDETRADIGAFPIMHFVGLRILNPNGGETLLINQTCDLQWISGSYAGMISIELNCDYPSGSWETLFESTDNDGTEEIIFTGPPSSHCRLRISALSDTLSDISDGDFEITAHLTLQSPNGSETWNVYHYDTVRWAGGGFDSVYAELNRAFPNGEWELLMDTTANDGEEVVWITDPLSDNCRVRIVSVYDTLADTSDADFSIISSQGYLALVKPINPTVPIIAWNAGTVECPQSMMSTYRLKNFGSEAIVVFQPTEPPTIPFSRITNCGAFFALAPGQMSTCSLSLVFDPSTDGTHSDILVIQTDAVNAENGYITIPLSGTQVSTPHAPETVIQPNGSNINLAWSPVTESVGGCPVTITGYLVFFSEVFDGPYWFHGGATDTTYVHPWVIPNAAGMFYHVIASTAPFGLLQQLPPYDPQHPIPETEVLHFLRSHSITVE